jgi:hypothetical protein
MDMKDIMYQQMILARNGVPLSESNQLADFEREAFVDIAVKYEEMKMKMMSLSLSPT